MDNVPIDRNDSITVELDPHSGNRPGMAADATGNGKTVSLMVPPEGFSLENMGKQRTVGNQIGRQVPRGALGGIFGGKR